MIRCGLAEVVRARGSDGLARALQGVLRAMPEGRLPIRGESGGRLDPRELTLTLLSERRLDPAVSEIRVGVFFTEIVGGCSCGDAPFAVSGYQELRLLMDWDARTLEVRDDGC